MANGPQHTDAGTNPAAHLSLQYIEQMRSGMAYGRMLGEPCADFLYLYANPAFHAQLGVEGLAGRRCAEATAHLLEPELGIIALLDRVIRHGANESLEVRIAATQQNYLISAYCPQPGHFIASFENITATKEAEHRKSAATDTLNRMLDMSTFALRRGGLHKVFGKVIGAAMVISQADFGNIQLLDPHTGDLRVVAHRGRFPKWWLAHWENAAQGHGTCGSALQHRKRIIVEDIEHSPLFAGTATLDIQLRAGIRALQSTPIVTRSGEPIGTLSTHFKRPHRPDEIELLWLDLLAQFLADLFGYVSLRDQLRSSERVIDSLYRTQVSRDLNLDLLKKQVNGLCMALGQRPIYPNGYPTDMKTLFTYYLGQMR
ncbi:MAG: GAF domain-containing protein [Rhodocyclaceae bacterium]|nr:GAF domain-containing protein [Rhodocyclaceae bacterium]MBX3668589.1 GAF domain-containing protein [Rhodocyclaceae bacterium]